MKINEDMIVENKEIKQKDKGLINPEDIQNETNKLPKKIKIKKNDIVERDEIISTEDGRQLLK